MPKKARRGAVHPSTVIQDDFLTPLGKTTAWLAAGLELPEAEVAALLQGQRALTARTALRLEWFLGSAAEFWLGLQAAYEVDRERARPGPDRPEPEPADLPAHTRDYQRAVAARCQQLAAALPEERAQAAALLQEQRARPACGGASAPAGDPQGDPEDPRGGTRLTG